MSRCPECNVNGVIVKDGCLTCGGWGIVPDITVSEHEEAIAEKDQRIAAIEAERDDIDARLRELYDEYTNRQEGWNSEQAAELTALRAEVERLRVDAERLDAIERQEIAITPMGTEQPYLIIEHLPTGKLLSSPPDGSLRQCIDAAIAAKPEPEKTK